VIGKMIELKENLNKKKPFSPTQEEMPFAVVQGKNLTTLPKDLYIPPDALEIILEAFEGPLDLLLYLIRRQNLNILEIDVAEISKQYMGYIDLMKTIQLEVASDYLVMAAMLTEIKSRMLLPKRDEEVDEEDPRAELIRRLQDYERFKAAADDLDQLPRLERDTHPAKIFSETSKPEPGYVNVEMNDLIVALADVMARAEMFESHQIQFETLSTRERMSDVLERISNGEFVVFNQLFSIEEGKIGVVVTFLAIMELLKERLVDIVQNELFGSIHLRLKK
jgi:segregation and condensation protein A